ncbi:MAG: hypothetical protein JSS66_18050 [Armatimonadetes bacterium]|nr:hypothetical protein [Armatimonadota bacterium]
MTPGRFILIVLMALFAAFFGFKIVVGLLGWAVSSLLHLVVPLAIVAGVIYIVFRATEKKVLGGGKRGILP